MGKLKELEKLCSIFGPSGYEQDVQEYFEELMSPHCEITYDAVGNCYAHIPGHDSLPHVMYTAHADSIGSLINHIDSKGFIMSKDIADFDMYDIRGLQGSRVQVHSRIKNKLYDGIHVPDAPYHYLEDFHAANGSDEITRRDLCIDIGHSNAESVESIFQRGDFIALKPEPHYLKFGKTEYFQCANVDDRAGLYALWLLAKKIDPLESGGSVTFVSTVQEETISTLAACAQAVSKPDIAITIDVTIATDHIDESNEEELIKKFGKVSLGDGVTLCRGVGVNDPLFLYLETLAIDKNIPQQYEHATLATENVHIQHKGKGVITALTSIPMRYPHTPYEMVCKKDIDAVVDLNYAFYRDVSTGKFPE